MGQQRFRSLAGGPPRSFAGGLYDPSRKDMPDVSGTQFDSPGPGSKGGRTTANAGKSKFNLRGVIEVLEEYELDPTAEIAKALKATKKVKVDDKEVDVPVIDADTRAKLSLSLLEYVAPKLKSVEITQKGPELTNEQIDQRIEALLARAAANKKTSK